MKQIQVLGVDLQDYTVREAMRRTEAFFKDAKVSTIAYITTRGLMAAEHSEERKSFLSQMDMTVAADSDILRAAGAGSRNRVRETDNDDFMTEFLKKLIRGRKTVYLLTGTAEQMRLLEEVLRSYQENLRIVGSCSLDTLEQDEEYLVNEINILLPNVIISNIPSPQREDFFEANHMKLNANIWLMLKDEVVHAKHDNNPLRRITDSIVKKLFRRQVVKYKNQEKEE
jgi:N-acetylglucosaminyldiphosphoundecaprenol N-acetyl-beta-D-mannosaminyltransferase